jgi:hypothetical protein
MEAQKRIRWRGKGGESEVELIAQRGERCDRGIAHVKKVAVKSGKEETEGGGIHGRPHAIGGSEEGRIVLKKATGHQIPPLNRVDMSGKDEFRCHHLEVNGCCLNFNAVMMRQKESNREW